MTRIHYYLLIAILFLSLVTRLIGQDWDQSQHLHPDERFLTMVATSLSWPDSLHQYFDTALSPLNPNNQKFDFYVYGTYPVIFIKFVSGLFRFDDYMHLPLVGRAVSALLDTLVVYLVYLIARHLFPSSLRAPLWAAFVYSISVLPIQLSHFFAVDTYLVFFITLSFYLFLLLYTAFPSSKTYLYSVLLGLCYGLGLGAKISGLIFLPTLFMGFLILLIKHKQFISVFLVGIVFTLFTYLSLRVSLPYLFANSQFFTISLNPQLLHNWQDLSFQSQPNHFAPPATQWIHVIKGWFPFVNLTLIGLGFPLALVSYFGLVFVSLKNLKSSKVLLCTFFVISLFVYQSLQFAQPMRYFYPIYPFLAIFAGAFLDRIRYRFSLLAIPLLLIWPISFLTIYLQPHSRVQASNWIYHNLPPGSRLSCEYWDDCLPLFSAGYKIIQLEPYAKDSPEKWAKFLPVLSKIDYLILSSNRLYASIDADPQYYPQTSKFYEELFADKLGFTKVNEFTSRPHLPLPFIHLCLTPPWLTYGTVAATSVNCTASGITFIDDYADETFTVYDHPKVTIFKNTGNFSVTELSQLIRGNNP